MNEQLDTILSHFYEAALDPAKLRQGLLALADATRAEGASYVDASQGKGNVLEYVGFSDEAHRAYHGHYHKVDQLLHRSMRLPVGTPVNDWREFGPGFGRSEFYNDFLQAFGKHAVMGIMLVRDGERMAGISLQRAAGQSHFEAEDERFLLTLAPHLRRACLLHAQAHTLRQQSSLASTALDQLSTAVWVVEADGRVLLMNRAARTMDAAGVLRCRDGRLTAPDTPEPFAAALRHAAQPLSARSDWLLLQPRGQRVPAAILPLSPSSSLAAPFQRPAAVVMISPRQEAPSLAHALTTLFGLTPAEARVAERVGAGVDPQDVAIALGTAMTTVRTQLKAVYAKLGIRRQAELARLVAMLRMPATHDAR